MFILRDAEPARECVCCSRLYRAAMAVPAPFFHLFWTQVSTMACSFMHTPLLDMPAFTHSMVPDMLVLATSSKWMNAATCGTVLPLYMAQSCRCCRGGCADVDRMLARSEPMDLAQNVFHHGVWGTLRHDPLSSFPEAFMHTLPPTK